MFTLDNLKPLYAEMRNHGLGRCHFPYRNGRGNFDVFFFTDESPFVLLFGAKGKNLAFEVDVLPGFKIDTYLSAETLNILRKALGLDGGSGPPFKPSEFFNDFNLKLAQAKNLFQKVEPQSIGMYRKVEEQDKVYFWGWRDNEVHGDHVTDANLKKTRLLLGYAAYTRSKEKNISTRWTDDPAKAVEVILPE